MALEPGDETATSGMTQAIYEKIRDVMEPDLVDLRKEDLEDMRKGWRKLSFAIAAGVINHIRSDMEIVGIQTKGTVGASTVTTVQTNDGLGHVK